MRIVIASTGASGAIYLQRLLDQLDTAAHQVHLVLSPYARQVIQDELGKLRVPPSVQEHNDRSMNVPFASGSARFDGMAIIPCSMGTVARIAGGVSDSLITRTADVFLKERRKLVIVPRETPLNLIQTRNLCVLLEAGAVVLPAMPSFYGKPAGITELVDTVVHRVLDQLGMPVSGAYRWFDGGE